MNGVHDLGGMHGFGPVEREENEPLFHAAWEAHVRAMATLTMGRRYFNIDEFRYGIERIPPAVYLRSSYFERWLATVESNLIREGYLTGAELEERVAFLRDHPDADPPRATSAPTPQPQATPPEVPPPAPRFAVGDAIVTRNAHSQGHTRLPRYARGKPGVIHRLHGAQTFPDTNAHGLGRQPQMLYSVRFAGRDLWGDTADRPESLYLDLWDSYLDPAMV